MKGIVLAGGYGTRLRPLTSVTNKHMLPVYCLPLIFYPIKTLKDLNITNICIVLGGESVGDCIRLLADGNRFGARFTYVYQQKAGGIAQAVGLCEDFVADDNFIVILGDNLFLGSLSSFKENFEKSGKDCGIVLAKVDNPIEYGVPRFDDAGKIVEIIEKPKVPSSKFAVTGFYAYTSSVFDEIRKLKPSARGELEISDVHTSIIASGKGIYWEVFEGKWFDCGGSFDGLLNAAIAVRDESTAA